MPGHPHGFTSKMWRLGRVVALLHSFQHFRIHIHVVSSLIPLTLTKLSSCYIIMNFHSSITKLFLSVTYRILDTFSRLDKHICQQVGSEPPMSNLYMYIVSAISSTNRLVGLSISLIGNIRFVLRRYIEWWAACHWSVQRVASALASYWGLLLPRLSNLDY